MILHSIGFLRFSVAKCTKMLYFYIWKLYPIHFESLKIHILFMWRESYNFLMYKQYRQSKSMDVLQNPTWFFLGEACLILMLFYIDKGSNVCWLCYGNMTMLFSVKIGLIETHVKQKKNLFFTIQHSVLNPHSSTSFLCRDLAVCYQHKLMITKKIFFFGSSMKWSRSWRELNINQWNDV